eukprot:COSAG06_NODE_1027_length_11028_cov_3.385031_10_plen_48_part_00
MPLADYAKFYEMLLNNGVGPATVSKNGLFEPFKYKNDHFTKTGSGRT